MKMFDSTKEKKIQELLSALQLLEGSENKTLLSKEFAGLFSLIKEKELTNIKTTLVRNNIISLQSQGRNGGWLILYTSAMKPNISMCERAVSKKRFSNNKQQSTTTTLNVKIDTQEKFLQQIKKLKQEFENNTSFKVDLEVNFSIVQHHKV